MKNLSEHNTWYTFQNVRYPKHIFTRQKHRLNLVTTPDSETMAMDTILTETYGRKRNENLDLSNNTNFNMRWNKTESN